MEMSLGFIDYNKAFDSLDYKQSRPDAINRINKNDVFEPTKLYYDR